jgi:hypothetical protein
MWLRCRGRGELGVEVVEHEASVEVAVDADRAAQVAMVVGPVVVDRRSWSQVVVARGWIGLERRLQGSQQDERAVTDDVGLSDVDPVPRGALTDVVEGPVEVGTELAGRAHLGLELGPADDRLPVHVAWHLRARWVSR